MRAVVAFLSAAVAFGALDFLWLSNAAPRLYRPAIGEIMADQVRWGPALAFYGLYLIGVTWLVTLPALKDGGLAKALGSGALFGLVAYATYDLTNQATLRVWPTHLTLIDLAWGTFATATASVVAVVVTRALVKSA
ncbi:MAG TPA: DUF2177 family protein [Brevundimonas sp.]|jgi:uncharacterized membrane protein|uniref:DUF2177 family protein n=1 Tax=Brevundimonas sp. TaxID=1871086 RepID=UPI002C80FD0D|nr:DUF2177 family protein [Brevundimonas sp.]HRH20654.1 DUF2177 family protein [Brevundimonas sp.]